MTAYILAAGLGSRIAPYDQCRPKCLLPVGGQPLLDHILDALATTSVERTVVAAGRYATDIRNATVDRPDVEVCAVGATDGTAETLAACLADDGTSKGTSDGALVQYGDVLLSDDDLARLLTYAESDPTSVHALVAKINDDESGDWIVARVEGDRVTSLVGHPRGGPAWRVAGVVLPAGFRGRLEACPTYFPNVEVGMMPPPERHLEAAIETWRHDGNPVYAVHTTAPTVDLDKPWHILEANEIWLSRECAALTENELADGARIDKTASIDGHIRLGKNSRIGRNVIIRGSLIAGDDVVIDAGAIINGNAAIGDGSFVGNACFIEGGSVVGRHCVVSHAAELSGVIFDGVYLYHYMEIYGVVGENTDIGAATVCGSLRFDDGATSHRIRGRREIPRHHSNATFIGDYCRTGVNATIMPGKKVGPYGIVGPGVLLEDDLPPGTGIRVKQTQERFSWGPNRYGW